MRYAFGQPSNRNLASYAGFGLAFCIGLTVSLLITRVKADPPAAGSQLENLVSQLKSASSLHFLALAEVKATPAMTTCCPPLDPYLIGDGRPVKGRLEYWAAGASYRVNSYLDPAQYPGMNTQIAFDGNQFQMLLPSSSVFVHAAGDKDDAVAQLPNPLIDLLLQFRYPVTDEWIAKRIRLSDVKADQIPPEFWNVTWEPVQVEGRILDRAEFPGGTYEGTPYVHHVYAASGEHGEPVRVDRVAGGNVLSSTEFAHDYDVPSPSGMTTWPRSVDVRAYDASGNLAIQASFVITEFQLDPSIDPSVFVINPTNVEHVWNADLEQFE